MTTTPRKSAAAKPAPDGTTAVGEPTATTPAQKAAPPEPPQPEPAGDPGSAAGESGTQSPAGETSAPAPAFHWETAAGQPGDPCRECNPAGPPPNAGSIGCAHGQWVRVADTG